MRSKWTEVYVGIGSNVEPARHVALGLDALRARFGPLRQSTIWRSRAVGFDGADFYNLVVGFSTELGARALNAELDAIETAGGRDRASPRYAPRTLDLDLLLFGDLVEPDLRLPRRDITRYAFVLQPLAEIAAERRHPVTGLTFAEHWRRFETDEPPLVAVPGGS